MEWWISGSLDLWIGGPGDGRMVENGLADWWIGLWRAKQGPIRNPKSPGHAGCAPG